MSDLATRLMMQNRDQQAALPTAIFGTAGTVRHALQVNDPVRIGLWPIISANEPRIAMGVFVMLSYLLERYQGIRVYRIAAQVDDDPDSYVWEIGHSQFDVDDWQIEDLDDNVGIWGALDGWNLTLSVENDVAADEDEPEVEIREYPAQTLTDLVDLLPRAAADIATMLDASELKIASPAPNETVLDEAKVRQALERLFDWELKLYLSLWGQEWTEHQIAADAETLLSASEGLGNLGAWVMAHALARVILFADDAEFYLPLIDKVVQTFTDSRAPAILLANALYEASLPQEAYDLLESEIDEGRVDAQTYLAAADLYRRGGRTAEAIDILQVAIEEETADVRLYQRYAELLIAMEYSGLSAEALVLIDPEETPDDELLWEAVEAYESALEMEPENLVLISRQLLQLIELGGDDERLWPRFEELVRIDGTGDYIRTVVDAFDSLEDVTPAIEILTQAARKNSERPDLYLSLASVYTLEEDEEAALNCLGKARTLTSDPALLMDIERLTLLAEDPEFETRLGEITDVLNAGNSAQIEDVEFLEHIIAEAPAFAEAHVLLAQAYLGWDEPSSALETLLDGHKRTPDDPDILVLLGQVLWDSGEEDLAFSYLSQGITRNPNHVPLLALAGQYLFEDGQEDAAKAYLMRAESIAPRDPMLIRVRQYIGRLLGQ